MRREASEANKAPHYIRLWLSWGKAVLGEQNTCWDRLEMASLAEGLKCVACVLCAPPVVFLAV